MKKITHFYKITRNVVIYHWQNIVAVTVIATIFSLMFFYLTGIYKNKDVYISLITCAVYPTIVAYIKEIRRFKELKQY